VDLYNSYAITASGQATGTTGTATAASVNGWDFQTVQPGAGNELLYDIIVPVGSTATELSVALTWNAEVSAPFNTGDPVLADLNLELVDSNGSTIDTDLSDSYVDGISASDVDNVEHIYLTNLLPGTYTLKVSSLDSASEFGLAWRTATAFDTISADFDADGDVDGRDFLTWQANYGAIVNASRGDGDADGDGDVDSDDLVVLHTAIAATSPAFAANLLAVPEPSSLLVAASGLILVAASRRRRRN
ncbi:MAG: PEP-CTERM sorting domain-containing protein, partial [Planctomycetota bacterium]